MCRCQGGRVGEAHLSAGQEGWIKVLMPLGEMQGPGSLGGQETSASQFWISVGIPGLGEPT